MKKWGWLTIVVWLGVGGTLLWQGVSTSLFADHRAREVGDVITILVVEYASASTEATTTTQKENDHSFLATGGAQSQAYAPLYGLRGNVKNRFDGDASVSRQGRLQTKVTTSVTEIRSNGNLVIQGSRMVEVNGEKEITTISGVVRPQDVSGDNTVFSYQVADVEITYKGKGVVTSGQKPGWIAKVFNWIF